jgi:cycloeucalenol cycloisomerase
MDAFVIVVSILVGLCLSLLVISTGLKRSPSLSTWLPNKASAPAAHATETWFLAYGALWITCFGFIIGCQWYTFFDKIHYLVVCGGLALPLYLQPWLFPCDADKGVPLTERYAFKANVWLAIFGFVGNYFYTHYFYTVLSASYSMPSWDLNGVPVAMYLATHFYFSFYHTLSNCAIRKVRTAYAATATRTLFEVVLILSMSYFTGQCARRCRAQLLLHFCFLLHLSLRLLCSPLSPLLLSPLHCPACPIL